MNYSARTQTCHLHTSRRPSVRLSNSLSLLFGLHFAEKWFLGNCHWSGKLADFGATRQETGELQGPHGSVQSDTSWTSMSHKQTNERTLLEPSWEPRYLAGRLEATGSCCSFMMTLPSLSRGSHAEPTAGTDTVSVPHVSTRLVGTPDVYMQSVNVQGSGSIPGVSTISFFLLLLSQLTW